MNHALSAVLGAACICVAMVSTSAVPQVRAGTSCKAELGLLPLSEMENLNEDYVLDTLIGKRCFTALKQHFLQADWDFNGILSTDGPDWILTSDTGQETEYNRVFTFSRPCKGNDRFWSGSTWLRRERCYDATVAFFEKDSILVAVSVN